MNKSHPHWQYFIAIMRILERTGRYVEIAPANFKTYFIEFARIYFKVLAPRWMSFRNLSVKG